MTTDGTEAPPAYEPPTDTPTHAYFSNPDACDLLYESCKVWVERWMVKQKLNKDIAEVGFSTLVSSFSYSPASPTFICPPLRSLQPPADGGNTSAFFAVREMLDRRQVFIRHGLAGLSRLMAQLKWDADWRQLIIVLRLAAACQANPTGDTPPAVDRRTVAILLLQDLGYMVDLAAPTAMQRPLMKALVENVNEIYRARTGSHFF